MGYVTIALATTLCLIAGVYGSENVDDLPFGTSFLTPSSKSEYTKVEKANRGRFLKEVYLHADESTKTNIVKVVLPKCYSWWMTDAQRNEVEVLHALGDHVACKHRVHQFLNEQPKEKRSNIESYWEFCEHLWYTTHHFSKHNQHSSHAHADHQHKLRFTRHTHTSFDDFATDHLSWLSESERAEVKKLHEESKEKARDKVLELMENSVGKKKSDAILQLQAACRELVANILGDTVAKELKALKESGATNEELSKKVTELLALVKDDEKKAKALEHKLACEKVYNLKASIKTRRAVQNHDLETKFRNEWKWLDDKQKEEVRQLKTSGKNDEFLLSKVFEYFKSAKDKNAAEDGLQTSCGGAVLTILGPEKAEELKTFMANGAKPEAYEAKVKALLSSAPKKTLTKNQESCKLVFTQASRKRRHDAHQHKTLEDFIQSHLDWLQESQKKELLELKKSGKTPAEIQTKVMQFYDATTGDVKEKATASLKNGCKEVLQNMITPEQYAEVKKLSEAGATPNDISVKITEFVKTITDKEKLLEAKKYEANCKKLFGITSRRRRHDHGSHHTLEDYIESPHMSWLTQSQKESLRKLAQEGKKKEVIQQQVLEYYEATSGDLRRQATANFQAACREVFTDLLDADKVAELAKLKNGEETDEQLEKKAKEHFDMIEDEVEKKRASFHAVGCRKAFGIKEQNNYQTRSVRHKRHDHNDNNLAGLFKTYLNWLSEDQQKMLIELKNKGTSREELHKQVLKYYEETSAEVKEKAKSQIQDGCRQLLVKVLGEEKAGQLKKLRESGTSLRTIAQKTAEWINQLSDENVKKSAREYTVFCNRAFNVE